MNEYQHRFKLRALSKTAFEAFDSLTFVDLFKFLRLSILLPSSFIYLLLIDQVYGSIFLDCFMVTF